MTDQSTERLEPDAVERHVRSLLADQDLLSELFEDRRRDAQQESS